MALVDPDQLLDQADRLTASTGGGAPRQVDLRRAISNAYYALFHAVTTEAADDFIGRTHRQTPRYQLVYRGVDHRPLLRLCEDIVKTTLPVKYSDHEPTGGFGAELQFFARAVIDLQEKRHLANYDPLFYATKSEAALVVETGRAALARFKSANRAQRRMFVSLLLFPPR